MLKSPKTSNLEEAVAEEMTVVVVEKEKVPEILMTMEALGKEKDQTGAIKKAPVKAAGIKI